MTNGIVLIGAGRHASVVLDMIQENGLYPVIGILERDSPVTELLGVHILGGDELLPTLKMQGAFGAVVAIGDNHVRRKLFDYVLSVGLEPISVIHRSAVISRHAQLGRGV